VMVTRRQLLNLFCCWKLVFFIISVFQFLL
jgi:hypothetical protein